MTGDEEDGYDETLIPVDFKSAGQILDDGTYMIDHSVIPYYTLTRRMSHHAIAYTF
jgi:hypothetical protein